MMDHQVMAAPPRRKEGSHQVIANDLKIHETFFTISSDLICIVSLDGYFQKINPAFERVLGYTQEEAKQNSFLDLTHPDDVVCTLAEIAKLKKQNPLSNLTNRYRCQDGTYRWLTWSSQPIEGTNLVYASARDMTEQMEAEADLARSEEKFRLLAENMADVVMLNQPDNTIDYVSPSVEKILGYNPQELVGTKLCTLFHPENISHVREESHQRVLTNWDEHCTVEYRIRKKDGAYVWFETTSKKIIDNQGQVTAIVTSSRDVSKRKNERERARLLEQSLRASNKELENFAYMASHDLQEPLRVISSYLQVLQRRYQPQLDERAGTFIHYAVDGASRMKRLITDLLAYSKVNTLLQAKQAVDLNAVLAQITDDLQLSINQTQATLQYSALPTIYANETLMYRVFLNLISNAIKFRSPQPPHIEIAVVQRQHEWQFRVSDNGIGISPEYADTIFDIFKRLNGHKYEGTGMGLSIVKKVIENHQGTIEVVSQEGQGSTFCFTLPIHHPYEYTSKASQAVSSRR